MQANLRKQLFWSTFAQPVTGAATLGDRLQAQLANNSGTLARQIGRSALIAGRHCGRRARRGLTLHFSHAAQGIVAPAQCFQPPRPAQDHPVGVNLFQLGITGNAVANMVQLSLFTFLGNNRRGALGIGILENPQQLQSQAGIRGVGGLVTAGAGHWLIVTEQLPVIDLGLGEGRGIARRGDLQARPGIRRHGLTGAIPQ